MRTFYTTLLAMGLSLLAQVAGAVPAKPGVKKQIRLADGSVVTATLQGDERLSYCVLADGSPAVRGTNGRYRPETFENLQALRLQSVRREAARHGGLSTEQRRAARLPRRNAARAAAMEGQKKGLVLLVNFADNTFTTPNLQAYYQRFFNEAGFNEGGMAGSVHDYFLDQSYQRLSVSFDVVGPITLSQKMAYYGGPAMGDSDNMDHVLEMVAEACRKADAQVNFADYDWDGDGEVDQVYIVYAGYGEASGGDDDTIWPHEYGLGDQAIELDGVTVNTYACSNELNTDGTTTGIGTACHEFSHCLGLADHYDTSGRGNRTPGAWDLMASGSYNNNQCTPVGYTAFERWQSGWLTPRELTQPTVVTAMKPIDVEPQAYFLSNDNNPREFYIIENRQASKWNRYPGGHGLLIMHVDYDPLYFAYNVVNADASRLRMQVVAADGSVGGHYEGDTWPGSGRKTRLTDDSSPAATVYAGDRDDNFTLGKPLTDIVESTDGTVSFAALQGVMAKPVMQPFTDVTPGAFTAHWTSVPDATGYTVALRSVPAAPATPAQAVRLNEDFEKCVAKSVSINGIGNKLDDYLNHPGFTGTYCYRSPGGLQLGRGANLGTLKTPDLDEPLSGLVSVFLGTQPTGSNTQAVTRLSLYTGGQVARVTLTSTGQALNYVPTEEGLMAETPFSLELEAVEAPVALYRLIVLDGVFSDEEIDAWLATVDAPAQVQWQCVQLPVAPAARRAARVKGTSTTYTTQQPTYSFSGLDPHSNYFVCVKAHSAAGDSRWSAERQVDMPDAILSPLAPAVSAGRSFDLSGRPATPRRRGIVVRQGRLVMQ